MILNIGCGHKIPAAYNGDPDIVNVDRVALPGIHRIWDLNVRPWPWDDNVFDAILAFDILEHLNDIVPTMDECWRILRAGGRMVIRGPAWDMQQSYNDPTHKHWFTLASFDFFDPDTHWGANYGWYTQRKWKKVEAHAEGCEFIYILEVRK